jgi:hypothetical protein
MVVEGPSPAGRLHLAVKAWDEAGNVSDLSNVVTVAGE